MLTEALPEGEKRGLQRAPHRLDLPVPLPNSHPDPSSAASTTLPLQVQSLYTFRVAGGAFIKTAEHRDADT